MIWTAYAGEARGANESVSVKRLGTGTKHEALGMLESALRGRKGGDKVPILRNGMQYHSYYATLPSHRN